MIARYAGTCATCGQKFHPGTEIESADGRRYRHATCQPASASPPTGERRPVPATTHQRREADAAESKLRRPWPNGVVIRDFDEEAWANEEGTSIPAAVRRYWAAYQRGEENQPPWRDSGFARFRRLVDGAQ